MPYADPEESKAFHHRWYMAHRKESIEAMQKWRIDHPERRRQLNREHYQRLRLKVFNKLGGAKCVYCGCDDIRILEVNHINGGGGKEQKKLRASHNGKQLYEMIASGERATDDLNVTCRVCNMWHYVGLKYPDLKSHISIRWIP